jgi:dephospho-CoA kinase
MIRVGILGDIGSGKSYIAKNFGYPVFNADNEVGKLYKKNKKVFNKLQKALPKYIFTFPIDKKEITRAILANKANLRKIIKIVHNEIRKKMNIFLRNNRNKKIIILDIPLLLENKINKKNDILIFVEANQKDTMKRLRQRANFNLKIFKKFKKIQFSLDYKKKKSNFIIKNNFASKSVKKRIEYIVKKII